MPGWQASTDSFVKAGKLVVIGVMQDQHADRCRLYRQWRQLKWPLYIDALNTLDHRVVPIPIFIDESGIIRRRGRVSEAAVREFVEARYPVTKESKVAVRLAKGDLFYLKSKRPVAFEKAIKEYAKAGRMNGRALFRTGVVYRTRCDSPHRKEGDGQKAVEYWGAALALQPNQYIWRRRIQQYGPRLDKPYNFFFWVEEARKAIRARGEKPVELAVEPRGSEIAPKARKSSGSAPSIPDPDPKAKINRDLKGHVSIETVVTPARVRPGHRVRIRATFRLNPLGKPWWNNEGDPLSWTIRLPKPLRLAEGTFQFKPPAVAETRETRVLECEVEVDRNARAGKVVLPVYALYGVCEERSGQCLYLRQDGGAVVVIDPKAPKIQ